MNWLKSLPSKVWIWLASGVGALVLLVSVYLSARSVRKGQIEAKVAEHEIEKADAGYDQSMKQSAELRAKSVRLVSDILAEQKRRDDEAKQAQRMSDAEVLEALRKRGDIIDPPKSD